MILLEKPRLFIIEALLTFSNWELARLKLFVTYKTLTDFTVYLDTMQQHATITCDSNKMDCYG